MLMNLMMLKVSATAFGDDIANDMPSITHTHSRKGYSNAFAIRAMRLIIVAGALLSPFKVDQLGRDDGMGRSSRVATRNSSSCFVLD